MSEQLYRMYDADGVLLYVGISKSAIRRMTEHADTQPWWPEVATQTIENLDCDRAQAQILERQVIANEAPKYNIAHNVKHVKATRRQQTPDVRARVFHPLNDKYVMIPNSELLPQRWIISMEGRVVEVEDSVVWVGIYSPLHGAMVEARGFRLRDTYTWRIFSDVDEFNAASRRAYEEFCQWFDQHYDEEGRKLNLGFLGGTMAGQSDSDAA